MIKGWNIEWPRLENEEVIMAIGSTRPLEDAARIAYRELDVDTPTGKAAFAQLGARGVPVLLTNGQRVSGFSTQSYDAVFASRK